MRRLTIALVTVILLAILFPCFSTLAQSIHTPHENPATAEESATPASILSSYSTIFKLASTRDYGDAQRVLQEAEHGNIPVPLRDMINQYRSLSQQLVTDLNKTESLLDEVSTLASGGDASEVRQKLEYAGANIRDTEALLDDIQTAVDTLGDKLGVFDTSVDPKISEAHQYQLDNLSQLRSLVNELNSIQANLGLDPQSATGTKFFFSRPTIIEISTPELVYPGLPFTIEGRVSPNDGSVERTIDVFLDDVELIKETVKGKFSLDITIPRETISGEHSLTVLATPQERYLDASESLIIDVLRVPIRTDIEVPNVFIMPKSIEISGKVYQDSSPVSDAQISINFKDFSTTVKTATDGGFSTSIKVPFSMSLIGPEELGIMVEPTESWYTSLETKGSILVVNPVYAGLIMLLLGCAGVVLLKRVGARPVKLREEMLVAEAKRPEPASAILPPRLKYEFTGITERILSAYVRGLETTSKASNIPMMPHNTLREFLNDVVSSLPQATRPFGELTTLAEYALYSAYRLEERMAVRAEQLVAIIKEELDRAAT